jgi:histidine ammonia-lyase
MSIILDGQTLDPHKLSHIAAGASVKLCTDGLARMAQTRRVIDDAVVNRTPVYGVTTGLGPRVVDAMPDESLQQFSLNTIRGRAHGVGEALPRTQVRAGMAVRANTLLIGAAGVRPELAEHIVNCMNADLVPLIPQTGTIGVADLTWGGALGLSLIGEGHMIDTDGQRIDSLAAMTAAGIEPWQPGPREGLALVSHSTITAGAAALGWAQIRGCLEAAQTTAALSMEAFRSNLSPLDERVLSLRPQPGQQAAARGLRDRLRGSMLFNEGTARRLQDPLSLRNVAQVHGALLAALDYACDALHGELNGASDNPAVVPEARLILSHGGYLPPHLCIALVALTQATIHLAALQVSRIGKLMFERFTGLSNGLTQAGAEGAGLGPLIKPAEALYAEITQLAAPPPIYPGISADGLEDVQTHTAIPTKSLFPIATRLRQLAAIEAIVAAQALELRGLQTQLPQHLQPVYDTIRAQCPTVHQDRPLGGDIDALANCINNGAFDL